MVSRGLYTPFVAALSFLFMDLSCASFSICFIFASQSGFPSARDWSCAIWWSHSIHASALDFCVVHSSFCSLVTSFCISFAGQRVIDWVTIPIKGRYISTRLNGCRRGGQCTSKWVTDVNGRNINVCGWLWKRSPSS